MLRYAYPFTLDSFKFPAGVKCVGNQASHFFIKDTTADGILTYYCQRCLIHIDGFGVITRDRPCEKIS